MALYKLEEFAANYGNADLDNYDLKNFDVYSDIDDDKVGSVKHILVDDSGRVRYLLIQVFGSLVDKYCYQLGVPE